MDTRRVALVAAEAQAVAHRAEAEAAAIKAKLSGDAALMAYLRLEIARLTRTLYGQRSEGTQRLIDRSGSIWRAMAGSCRPMPMRAPTTFMTADAGQHL